ncbi:MAG: RNA repair transcriptional activator RtcR [Pseudomonadota bacterium]
MLNVVLGFLGTQLDAGRKRKWRPTVQLCAHPEFPVARLEILHDQRWLRLAENVQRLVENVSPDTEVMLQRLDLKDPWDFEEVYGALFDFAQGYGFDEDRERYHVHLTTGTHVAQICWFLLAESRHIPARLVQTGPPRGDEPRDGTLGVIDLDLSRYNALQQRFDLVTQDDIALLKAGIETRNPAFNDLIARIERVASTSDAPILLQGATGTGKSELAERIYELKLQRRRVKGRLVHVNCATIQGERGLATLFGQRRGVGSSPERRGLLREADGGVLFLDEIDTLGPDEQAAILHAIETGTFYPLGSDYEVSCRFHLIAGANRDLTAMVAEGTFRKDLFHRLNLWTFTLPDLRDRRQDIEPNVDYELDRAEKLLGSRVGFNADARQAYLRFAADPGTPWPGNFRDLGASIQRMCTLAPRGRITIAMVEEEIAYLSAHWASARDEPDGRLVRLYLGDAAEALDQFDLVQLAAVLRTCRKASSLSDAGRRLFAASRAARKSQNDADRLRKYLARFDLTWADIHG